MAIFKDFESKQDIFDLIEKFDESKLFELEISIPVPQPQCIKIKMMKLSQDNPDNPAVKVTIEDSNGVENFSIGRGDPDAPKHPKENNIIKSPLVGTFYASASPESESYVNVGDRITKGMVLCIIEAMKTMNQIPAPRSGTVIQILVEDGQPVEYGEPLMIIE